MIGSHTTVASPQVMALSHPKEMTIIPFSSTTDFNGQLGLPGYTSTTPNCPKEGINNRAKLSTKSAISTSPGRSRLGICGKTCLCDCHRKYRFQLPSSARIVLGTFFLSYRGIYILRAKCNYESCKNNGPISLHAVHRFPRWLVDSISMFSGNPSYGLFILRRLGWGGAEAILKSAYKGNIEDIKVSLRDAAYALHDIDKKHGRTALHVS